jgi:hypothetical protein
VPPVRLVRTVDRFRHHLRRLHLRSVPPPAAVLEMILNASVAQGITAAVQLGIPDALAAGPMRPEELARRVDANPDTLNRLLSAILTAAPSARGVLYDLPQVVAGAPELLAKYGIADRVQIVAGSFFAHVPPGADLYILKNIIHDWPEEQAVTILRNIRAAATPGTTLLLVESVIPEHDRNSSASGSTWRC